MSIESQQAEYMRQHHKWEATLREIEDKISRAKANGQDWKSMHEFSLDQARRQSSLNYELATDRGF